MSLAASFPNALAPAASPTHPVSMAQYATETWTRGGTIVGVVILALFIAAITALAKRSRRGSAASK
jgi:hypothetical protein